MGQLNILSNAKEKFNTLVKRLTTTDNILQYYDNVTYNIRFYMISNAAQELLSKLRSMGQITNYAIDENQKIIIAETGVSSNFSIDSLKMETVHANTCDTHSATTYSLEMRIKEVNGCQLVNQISAVSKLLGYESYIQQPFHIDVWFSGYNNETHMPVKIIKEVGVLTYEVIISEVNTNVELSGTTYNFICTCAGINSVVKEAMIVDDIGEITNVNGVTLKSFRDSIVDTINNNYFKANDNLNSYYKDSKYLTIRLIDIDDTSLTSNLADDYCSPSLRTATLIDTLYPETEDTNNTTGIHPNQNASLSSVFQDFCLKTDTLRTYLAKPVFKVQQVANTKDGQMNRIYVDVLFSNNNYLTQFSQRFADGKDSHTKDEIEESTYTMAYNHLVEIIAKGLLVKRYDWLFNGRDTSVLEVDTSMDKLWYANIPMWDLKNSAENITDDYTSIYGNDIINKIISQDFNSLINDELKNSIRDGIEKSQNIVNNVRNVTRNGCLYLEDIYYCMDKKTKSNLLNNRNIVERSNIYSESSQDSSSETNNDVIIAQTGYNNIYSAGNLVELSIKILGDPYWIQQCSDKCMFDNTYSSIGNLHYFLFKMNTCASQKTDGTYDLENVVDFCNIYQVVTSTSLFENGKFTQKIKGTISPEFMTLGRLEI